MKKVAPNAPESYFFTDDDLPLVEMQHMFPQSTIWHRLGMHKATATMDLVVREMPQHRNFLVFAGLEEIVSHLLNLRFTDDHIDFLLKKNLIKGDFVPYLKDFKFRGDIWAMKEGTVFFPGEPVVRITGPLIDVNIVTNLLINVLVSNTIFASKLARTRMVVSGERATTAAVRGHSFESGAKGTRASIMLRMSPMILPFFNRKYGIDTNAPYTTNAQHVFIKSFPEELDAMLAFAEAFPENCATMVDTYDFEKGVEKAVTMAKRVQEKGHTMRWVFVDSKPLLERTKYVRKRLDEEGLEDVSIIAGSNLEEKAIDELEKAKAPVGLYCAVTELITVSDAPRLEVVYKLAQIEHNGEVRDTAKLAPGKESYPGVKQVFRNFDKDGRMTGDVIGLADEKLGEPLLEQMVEKGKLVVDLPSFEGLQTYVDKQLEQLPENLRDIHKEHSYSVEISPKLQKLYESVKKHHQG